ncbi:MAG: hypothetical protein ACOCQD_01650 [archaeon]
MNTIDYDKHTNSVIAERPQAPLSEGDQIKIAIRTLFEESRNGFVFTEDNPLKIAINNVNGKSFSKLCLHKHPTKKGAVVMWYEN